MRAVERCGDGGCEAGLLGSVGGGERRAFWAALAVVRNRTGVRVAGGSQRWRATLKQMLPRHGWAPVPGAELCRRPGALRGLLP
jgi:hypothetical protein